LLLENEIVEFAAYSDSPDCLDEGAPHGRPLHAKTINLAEYLVGEDLLRRQVVVEGSLALFFRLASSVRGLHTTADGAIALHVVGSHASPRRQAAVLFIRRKMRV
jgi:hypothetical protein